MSFTFMATIHLHACFVLILFGCHLYIYFLLSGNYKAMFLIARFRAILPLIYTLVAIVFFTGIALILVSLQLGFFTIDFHFAYMVGTMLYVFIKMIKLYKMIKAPTYVLARDYKQQYEFLQVSKKTHVHSLLLLLGGSLPYLF